MLERDRKRKESARQKEVVRGCEEAVLLAKNAKQRARREAELREVEKAQRAAQKEERRLEEEVVQMQEEILAIGEANEGAIAGQFQRGREEQNRELEKRVADRDRKREEVP